MFHIRSADWLRHESGRSGPQLHSLFSELFYTVQPSDSNECWLWPLVFSGHSGNKSITLCACMCVCECVWVCASVRCRDICMRPLALLFRFLLFFWVCSPDVVGACRGAQSTVDGFYVIHTKTHRQRWMFTEASGGDVSRADRHVKEVEEGGREDSQTREGGRRWWHGSNRGGQAARHGTAGTWWHGTVAEWVHCRRRCSWWCYTWSNDRDLNRAGCALMRYHHLVSQSSAESFIFASKLAVTASETQTRGGRKNNNRQQRYYTVVLSLKGQFTYIYKNTSSPISSCWIQFQFPSLRFFGISVSGKHYQNHHVQMAEAAIFFFKVYGKIWQNRITVKRCSAAEVLQTTNLVL